MMDNSFTFQNIPLVTQMQNYSCESANLTKCPGKQQLDRQICVEDVSKCPINMLEVQLIPPVPDVLTNKTADQNSTVDTNATEDTSGARRLQASKSEMENEVQLTPELKLMFTKKADKLPITLTKIDLQSPCAVHFEINRPTASGGFLLNHPAEKQLYGCSRDQRSNQTHDNRYVKLDKLNVTEHEIRLNSGVQSLIDTIPFSDKIINSADKNNGVNSVFYRNAIKISPKCLKLFTKEDVFDHIESFYYSDDTPYSAVNG